MLAQQKAQEKQRLKKFHSTRLLAGRIVASISPYASRFSNIEKDDEYLSSMVKRKTSAAYKEIVKIQQEANGKLQDENPKAYDDSWVTEWPSLMQDWKVIAEAAEGIIAASQFK